MGIEPKQSACKAVDLPLASGPFCWSRKDRTFAFPTYQVGAFTGLAMLQYVDAIGFEPTSFTLWVCCSTSWASHQFENKGIFFCTSPCRNRTGTVAESNYASHIQWTPSIWTLFLRLVRESNPCPRRDKPVLLPLHQRTVELYPVRESNSYYLRERQRAYH